MYLFENSNDNIKIKILTPQSNIRLGVIFPLKKALHYRLMHNAIFVLIVVITNVSTQMDNINNIKSNA